MSNEFEEHSRERLAGRRRLSLPALLIVTVAGCTAMEGVNVGASIPVGVVNVGANKTLGESRAPAPSRKQPREEADETDPDESDSSDEAASQEE
jgi:hypothetical protein